MNLEFLKENIHRVLAEGRLPDVESTRLLTDEEIETIISQQETRNIPSDLKEHYFTFLRKCLKSINESFKSSLLLMHNSLYKDANFLLDNIFERINLIAYVSDKVKNEDENLHALLLELPIRNLLKFNYSSITMGNILTNNIEDDYDFDGGENYNKAYINQKFNNIFSSLSETVEDLNCQIEEEEETEEDLNDLRAVERKMTDISDFLLSARHSVNNEDFNFMTFKEECASRNGSIKGISNDFLSVLQKINYDAILIHKVFSLNNKLQAIYFAIKDILNAEDKNSLTNILYILSLKLNRGVVYNEDNINGLILSIKLTNKLLGK